MGLIAKDFIWSVDPGPEKLSLIRGTVIIIYFGSSEIHYFCLGTLKPGIFASVPGVQTARKDPQNKGMAQRTVSDKRREGTEKERL